MNRLKLLREEKRMKQSELGKLLNVQDAAISKYESGKVPLTDDTLLKLSKYSVFQLITYLEMIITALIIQIIKWIHQNLDLPLRIS